MRKALFLLLLVTAPAWSSQPNFIDQMKSCTHLAVGFTQLATLASQTEDSDKPAFDMYIAQLVQRQPSERSKAIIRALAKDAWAASRADVSIDGAAMSVYDKCTAKLGQTT